jgi:hydrogenase maturation protease
MKTLVAGIGNIFFGDDGFGVEVATRLGIADYGIRGVHLALELLEGYDALVLIDALPMGEAPGTVAVFEPDVDSLEPTAVVEAHSMSPAVVLGLVRSLGGELPSHVVIVGCEPLSVEEGIGLSDPVAAAIDPAAETVRRVVADLAHHQPALSSSHSSAPSEVRP